MFGAAMRGGLRIKRSDGKENLAFAPQTEQMNFARARATLLFYENEALR